MIGIYHALERAVIAHREFRLVAGQDYKSPRAVELADQIERLYADISAHLRVHIP